MSTLPFSTACDTCHRRSELYSAHPTCRECGEHVCPRCYTPGSYVDPDADCVGDPARYVASGHTALCPMCDALEQAETHAHALLTLAELRDTGGITATNYARAVASLDAAWAPSVRTVTS
jgi:hypothetical protein